MYKICVKSAKNLNQYEELVKVFLRPGEYKFLDAGEKQEHDFVIDEDSAEYINLSHNDKRDEIARSLYLDLSTRIARSPEWGILTGVRPVKLAGDIVTNCADAAAAINILKKDYLLSNEKAALAVEIYNYQQEILGVPREKSAAVYVGIPFCPTRCMYCSFTSNAANDDRHDLYMRSLLHEMVFVLDKMRSAGLETESLYIGGGTPTALNERNLAGLLDMAVDFSPHAEFTVEAGRPDTMNEEKLRLIRDYGAERISINPQTMKQRTLDIIGRNHSVRDVFDAYEIAQRMNFKSINMDLIAGLPDETVGDFIHSLSELIALGADNITVHTLAIKRASRLAEVDREYHREKEHVVPVMLKSGCELLRDNGYRPYYLYRQKHMSGAMENIGWCKNDSMSVYNVRIMEERQSIIAMGAGAISKAYFPRENRLERYPNVSNYEIYCDRIEDMIDRKQRMFDAMS